MVLSLKKLLKPLRDITMNLLENKSVWITKTGVYLKPMVIQCAFVAIKSKKQPYFAAKYGRSKKFHEHKKAIIAIARMIYSLHL